MTKKMKLIAINSTITQKHRAICKKKDYKSNWFSDIQEAVKQGKSHLLEVGKDTSHKVLIETEFRQQTVSYL